MALKPITNYNVVWFNDWGSYYHVCSKTRILSQFWIQLPNCATYFPFSYNDTYIASPKAVNIFIKRMVAVCCHNTHRAMSIVCMIINWNNRCHDVSSCIDLFTCLLDYMRWICLLQLPGRSFMHHSSGSWAACWRGNGSTQPPCWVFPVHKSS